MTNSKLEKRNEIIISEDQTSQDTARFVSNKGTEFVVKRQFNGLYRIEMLKGGKTPDICNGAYTDYKQAMRDLETYLRKNDRLGYAEYPSKKVTNGESTGK